MSYDDEYSRFIQAHSKHRSGLSLERLQVHHGHAEQLFLINIWWPAFHNFQNLFPEYEVRDYKDGYRYIDFAYIHTNFRIALEIDGLGPHWRNITKWQFSEHCQRQNHLVIDGWHVLRFSYDDVKDRPRLCQQTIQQLIGRLLGQTGATLQSLDPVERQILLLAVRMGTAITPRQVAASVNISTDTASRHLHKLCDASWMQPASGTSRIRSYRLHPSRRNMQL